VHLPRTPYGTEQARGRARGGWVSGQPYPMKGTRPAFGTPERRRGRTGLQPPPEGYAKAEMRFPLSRRARGFSRRRGGSRSANGHPSGSMKSWPRKGLKSRRIRTVARPGWQRHTAA
jgi:hypothetical protein